MAQAQQQAQANAQMAQFPHQAHMAQVQMAQMAQVQAHMAQVPHLPQSCMREHEHEHNQEVALGMGLMGLMGIDIGNAPAALAVLTHWVAKPHVRVVYDSDTMLGQRMPDVLAMSHVACVMVTNTGAVYGVYCPRGAHCAETPATGAFLFCFRQEPGAATRVMTPCRWMARERIRSLVGAAPVVLGNDSPCWDEETTEFLPPACVFQPVLCVRAAVDVRCELDPASQALWPQLVVRGPSACGYHAESTSAAAAEQSRRAFVWRDVHCVDELFDGIEPGTLLATEAVHGWGVPRQAPCPWPCSAPCSAPSVWDEGYATPVRMLCLRFS